MVKPCPDCQTGMLPADTFDCERVDWVCPECAPAFVTARASSFANPDGLDLSDDEWSDKYPTEQSSA